MLTLDRLDIDSAASLEDANHLLYRMGLTDGLPVVPPTRERVAAMLGNRDPERVVATLPPMQNRATARNLAACAVMAGCRPMDFDVLKAATAAVAEPEFNLFGIQTTTGAATPMLIVNGPVVHRLGLNAGANALGPGTRANASIGRALQFVLRTIGGADPGRGDKATMGQPGKFTLCCAENALDSPWEPLHVNRGFLAEQSTVTVVGAVGTVEVVDAESADAQGVLTTMARSMTIAGNLGKDNLLGSGEPLLLVAPEHAGIIGRTHTRRQAQEFLFQQAQLRVDLLAPTQAERLRKAAIMKLAAAAVPEDIMLVVVGGPGAKSTYVPTWAGGTRAVTRVVEAACTERYTFNV